MQQIVRKVVIALDDSTRIEGFKAQDEALGFEVFSAYDGRVRDGSEYFDADRAKEHWGHSLSRAQIGCAVSHRLVIEAFADEEGEDEDLLLVAEDDARFEDHFSQIVSRILEAVGSIDLLLLAEGWNDVDAGLTLSLRKNPSLLLPSLSLLAAPVGANRFSFSHRVGHAFGPVWGAGLYLISRKAAKKYMAQTDSFSRTHWIADDYLYWAGRAGIDVKICRPGLAFWMGESSITDPEVVAKLERAKPRGIMEKVSRRIALRTRLVRVRRSVAGTFREISLTSSRDHPRGNQ